MSKIRLTLALVATLTTTVTLAACSSTSGSISGDGYGSSSSASAEPGASAGPHNAADVAFLTGMVPHHKQAVEMADVILKKDGINSDVVTIAKKIKAEQDPEISTMTSWLRQWGTPMGGKTGMPGMGMMSDADMAKLDTANGADASRLFLQQMIQHHTGAIDMAKNEIGAGKNTDALALANSIVTGQGAEITEMQALLSAL